MIVIEINGSSACPHHIEKMCQVYTFCLLQCRPVTYQSCPNFTVIVHDRLLEGHRITAEYLRLKKMIKLDSFLFGILFRVCYCTSIFIGHYLCTLSSVTIVTRQMCVGP